MSEIIKKLTKTEYSKRANTWVLIVFAILVFTAMILIYLNPTIGGSLVGLIGVIMPIPSVSILAYSNKAKAENLVKLENSNVPTATVTTSTDTTTTSINNSTIQEDGEA